MRGCLAAILACTAALACERDPASNLKIVARPQGSSDSGAAKTFTQPPFNPALCVVQPEEQKGSTKFSANGPCSFHNEGDVKCRATVDDFYTMLLRQGPGNATVAIYLNIEAYKGPGTYEGGQMFLTAQNGDAYYHWSNDSVKTVVGPGLKWVDVPETKLDAEPPNTGTEIVSGRFWCANLKVENKE